MDINHHIRDAPEVVSGSASMSNKGNPKSHSSALHDRIGFAGALCGRCALIRLPAPGPTSASIELGSIDQVVDGSQQGCQFCIMICRALNLENIACRMKDPTISIVLKVEAEKSETPSYQVVRERSAEEGNALHPSS